MTEQDLISAGYHRYAGATAKLKHADYYYAKMLSDDVGKMFQMVFYVYDWSAAGLDFEKQGLSFMPDIQFIDRDNDMCVDVTLHVRPDYTLEFVEKYYIALWVHHGKPYYDKFGECR